MRSHRATPTLVSSNSPQVYSRIRAILESARAKMARSINTTQVLANWLVGREIVEEEQRGNKRADYGDRLVRDLAGKLQREYGSGYSPTNLKLFRKFYLVYAELYSNEKGYAELDLSLNTDFPLTSGKGHAARDLSASAEESTSFYSRAWRPGRLHPNLAWTHYRTLLRIERPEMRAFYEIESLKGNWSARELERQVNSLLYERLAKSRDKAGLMKLAAEGQEIQEPTDIFKDPVVIEFVGLPESPKLVESKLEEALITNLQSFLLELGKGFAFVSRQKRISLDGDHFYIDLVFYHTILKAYVLLDLKTGKLTHQDLGQLQLYVNYYDQEMRTPSDNPTLGLILCANKNDAVVKYTLGPEQQKKIFTSSYKLHLPTEAELKAEILREIKELGRT